MNPKIILSVLYISILVSLQQGCASSNPDWQHELAIISAAPESKILRQRLLMRYVVRRDQARVKWLLKQQDANGRLLRPAPEVIQFAQRERPEMLPLLTSVKVDTEASTMTPAYRQEWTRLNKALDAYQDAFKDQASQTAIKHASTKLNDALVVSTLSIRNNKNSILNNPADQGEELKGHVLKKIKAPLTAALVSKTKRKASSIELLLSIPGTGEAGWIAGDGVFKANGQRIGSRIASFPVTTLTGAGTVKGTLRSNNTIFNITGKLNRNTPGQMDFQFKTSGAIARGSITLSKDGQSFTGSWINKGKTSQWKGSPQYKKMKTPGSFTGSWKTNFGSLGLTQNGMVRQQTAWVTVMPDHQMAAAWVGEKMLHPEVRYIEAIDTWLVKASEQDRTWAVRTPGGVTLKGIEEVIPLPMGLNAALVRFGKDWGVITTDGRKLGPVEYASPAAAVRQLRDDVLFDFDAKTPRDGDNTSTAWLVRSHRARALSAIYDPPEEQTRVIVKTAKELLKRFGSPLTLVYLDWLNGLDSDEPYLSQLGWTAKQVAGDRQLINETERIMRATLVGQDPSIILSRLPYIQKHLYERRFEKAMRLPGESADLLGFHFQARTLPRFLSGPLRLCLKYTSDQAVLQYAQAQTPQAIRMFKPFATSTQWQQIEPIYINKWLNEKYSRVGPLKEIGDGMEALEVTMPNGEIRILGGLSLAGFYHQTPLQPGDFIDQVLLKPRKFHGTENLIETGARLPALAAELKAARLREGKYKGADGVSSSGKEAERLLTIQTYLDDYTSRQAELASITNELAARKLMLEKRRQEALRKQREEARRQAAIAERLRRRREYLVEKYRRSQEWSPAVRNFVRSTSDY